MLGISRRKQFDADKLPWAAMMRALRPELTTLVSDATSAAIAVALTRGLSVGVDDVMDAVAEWMPGYVNDWEKAIIRTTSDRVSAAVLAYEAGDIGIDELFDRVDKLFDVDRAELIAITETTRIFDVVNEIINEQSGVEKVRWLTVRDFAVCEICEPLDNQVFPIDEAPHPVDDTHDRCVIGSVEVAPGGRILATTERAYEGDLIVIRTALGNELTVTPNHPILTAGGWAPAAALYVGCDVVGGIARDWALPGRLDVKHIPAPIEQIARAHGESGGVVARPVVTAAPHFHGDGGGSEVAVVRADRELWDRRDSAFGEHIAQHRLDRGGVGFGLLARSSGQFERPYRNWPSSRRIVRCGDLRGAALCGHRSPLQEFGLGGGSGGYAGRVEPSAYRAARYAEPAGDREFAMTGLIQVTHGLSINLDTRAARGQYNSGASEGIADSGSGNTVPATEALRSLARSIALDQILDIDTRHKARTHVYNLQTESGIYLSNSIVSHNCRCFLSPEVSEATSRQPVAA